MTMREPFAYDLLVSLVNYLTTPIGFPFVLVGAVSFPIRNVEAFELARPMYWGRSYMSCLLFK